MTITSGVEAARQDKRVKLVKRVKQKSEVLLRSRQAYPQSRVAATDYRRG